MESTFRGSTDRQARIERNLLNQQYMTSEITIPKEIEGTTFEFYSWVYGRENSEEKSRNQVNEQNSQDMFESILSFSHSESSNEFDSYQSEHFEVDVNEDNSFESEKSEEMNFSNNSSNQTSTELMPILPAWENNVNEDSSQSFALSSVRPSANLKIPPLAIEKAINGTLEICSAPNSDRTKTIPKEVNWNLLIDELSFYSVNRNRTTKVKLK